MAFGIQRGTIISKTLSNIDVRVGIELISYIYFQIKANKVFCGVFKAATPCCP